MLKRIAAYFFTTLLVSLFVSIESNAATACFTPSAVKGCAPFTITLDPSCATYTPSISTPRYYYDFIANPTFSGATLLTTHTYNTPGTYRIRQTISEAGFESIAEIDIVVVDAPDPSFTVQTCVGRNVSLTMATPPDPGAVYDNYDINWGDGSAIENVAPGSTTTHTYASDGFKPVTVTGIFLPNAACASKTVTPYALTSLVKPDLTEIAVLTQRTSGGSIQLKYNVVQGQNYHIQHSTDGTLFSTIVTEFASTAGQMTYVDQNLNTQGIVHYYRIVTSDDCGLDLTSDPIYSIIINATPTNALNTVTWNGHPTVSNFTFTKNSVPQVLPSTTTSFPDNAIVCGSTYCYNTTAALATLTLSGVPQKSISIDTCIVAISTSIPPAPQDINSTINGSNATISWTSAGSNINYKLYESVNGGAYLQIAQQTATSYSYNLPNLSSGYCYQLDYADLCGNPSPRSLTTCPVILEGAISGTTLTLNWNTYTGFNNTGISSYAVQKLDQNGTVISETNVGGSTTFSEIVNLTDPYINYRIRVIPTNSAFSNLFSNNSLFKFEAEVFVPDIFTPNGDNTNDYFIVKGRYVNTYSITIFSRWGEVVYASTDMTAGWNGSNNFVYAPEGAYTYKIIATDINNKEFTKTGTVTLTR